MTNAASPTRSQDVQAYEAVTLFLLSRLRPAAAPTHTPVIFGGFSEHPERVICRLMKPMTTTSPSVVRQTNGRSSTATLSELASQAKSDRNRAVDFYRAVAMMAVALGHWAAISLSLDASGQPVGGNALSEAPGLSWITWIFQVMPLFFVVGGFSSAISLDSHNAKNGRPQDWVVARLRRMVAPAIVLAATWLGLVTAGYAVGFGGIVALGATTAAIPLWFLSNYTIDTAIAPYVLPAFRRNPTLVALGGLTTFVSLEALRLADLGLISNTLPHLNWVLGWLLFQVMGFAWKDGLLPTGSTLVAAAGALWAATAAVVAFGPYPVAMVHFPGITMSPTHPPSLALLLFGSAYSATALALAPAINRWLSGNAKAWAATVAANGMAMSVYLWHFTAASIAGAILFATGNLPTAAVGTAAWWIQKMPLIGLSMLILAGIVFIVQRFEQRALLAPRTAWNGGQVSMLATAAALSFGVKFWAHGTTVQSLAGMMLVLGLWHLVIKAPRQPRELGIIDELAEVG